MRIITPSGHRTCSAVFTPLLGSTVTFSIQDVPKIVGSQPDFNMLKRAERCFLLTPEAAKSPTVATLLKGTDSPLITVSKDTDFTGLLSGEMLNPEVSDRIFVTPDKNIRKVLEVPNDLATVDESQSQLKTREFRGETRVPPTGENSHLKPNWGPVVVSTVDDNIQFHFFQDFAGTDLFDVVSESTPDVSQVLSITKDVAVALRELHGMNIVHEDIKTENIAIGEDGKAALIDFGLTSTLETRGDFGGGAQRSAVGGTLPYIAPEKMITALYGGMCCFESDIYSLGLTMLFTLKPDTEGALMERALEVRNNQTALPPRHLYQRMRIEETVFNELKRWYGTLSDKKPRERKQALQVCQLISDMTRADPRNRPSADAVIKRINQIKLGKGPVMDLTTPPFSLYVNYLNLRNEWRRERAPHQKENI